MTRKRYAGAAAATTLDGALAVSGAASFDTAGAIGWPSAGPYVVVVDRGNSSEEKILVASRSGDTHTIQTRGYDGTTSIAHADGAAVEHCLDADTLDEANDHVNTTTRDDHTQYLNQTRHNVTALHQYGGALGVPGAPLPIGTTANAGDGLSAARENHVHIIGTGAINAVAMITDGLITGAKLVAGTISSTELGTDSVGSDEIAAGAVGIAELATAVAGDGLTGGGGSALAVVVDNATIEINADTLRVKAGGIGQNELADVASCSVGRAVAQSGIANNTWTLVQLTVEEWDPSGMCTVSDNFVTIPTTGIYEVKAEGLWTIHADLAEVGIGFNVHASGTGTSPNYRGGTIQVPSVLQPRTSYSRRVSLTAGQKVSLWVTHDKNPDANASIEEAYLQVEFLHT